MPFEEPVAFASFGGGPSVGEIVVSEFTSTRIPSKRSSCSMLPAGLVSAPVNTIADGSGLPAEINPNAGDVSSVVGGLLGSVDGTNSVTVPYTARRVPTVAVAGTTLRVKTKTPSDVAGSPAVSASSV